MTDSKPIDIAVNMKVLLGESIKKPRIKTAYEEIRNAISKVERAQDTYSSVNKAVDSLDKILTDDGSLRTEMPGFKKLREQMRKVLPKWVTILEDRKKRQGPPPKTSASPVLPRTSDNIIKPQQKKPISSTLINEKNTKSDIAAIGSGVRLKSEDKSKVKQLEDENKALHEDMKEFDDFMTRCMHIIEQHAIEPSTKIPKQGRKPKTKLELLESGMTNLDDSLTRLSSEHSRLEELASSLQKIVEKHKPQQHTNMPKPRASITNQQKDKEPRKLTIDQKCTMLQNEISNIDERLERLSSLQETSEKHKALMSKHEELSEEWNASLEIIEALEKLFHFQGLNINNAKKKGKPDTKQQCMVTKKTTVMKGITDLETLFNELQADVLNLQETSEKHKALMSKHEELLKELNASLEIIEALERLFQGLNINNAKKKGKPDTKQQCMVTKKTTAMKGITDLETLFNELQADVLKKTQTIENLRKELQSSEESIQYLKKETARNSEVKSIATKADRKKKDMEVEKKEKRQEDYIKELQDEKKLQREDFDRHLEKYKNLEKSLQSRKTLIDQLTREKERMTVMNDSKKTDTDKTSSNDAQETLQEITRISREQNELESILLKVKHTCVFNNMESRYNQCKDIKSKSDQVRESVEKIEKQMSRESPQSRLRASCNQDSIIDTLTGISEEQVELLRRARSLEQQLENQTSDVKRHQSEQLQEAKNMQSTIQVLQQQVQQITSEKEYWVNRYSEFAGATMSDNNSGIVDLSDQDRPSKLAEKMDELYTNQWIEAFDTIIQKKKCSEEESIRSLLHILKSTYMHCRETAKQQMDDLRTILLLTEIDGRFGSGKMRDTNPDFMTVQTRKYIKDARKMLARNALTVVIKRFVNDQRNSRQYRFELENCRLYFEACLEVCWLMCVQDPPVTLHWETENSQNFDKRMFRFYTKSGSKFDYVVWPAILLQEGGSTLCKGIAQPI